MMMDLTTNTIATSANVGNGRFSFFDAPVTNQKPVREVCALDVYKYLVSDIAKRHTMRLRELTPKKEEARWYKARYFDYVTFSGTFSHRADEGLVAHSGLMCLDFDHVGSMDMVNRVKERLLADSCLDTYLMFTSPSGDGVKWVVPIGLGVCDHRNWHKALSNYVARTYGLEADSSCANVSRACFLPYDPDAYLNPALRADTNRATVATDKRFNPWEWIPSDSYSCGDGMPRAATSLSGLLNAGDSPLVADEVGDLADEVERRGINLTESYDSWLRVGFALANGLGEGGRDYFHRLSRTSSKYRPGECDAKYTSCLRERGGGVTLKTLFGMAGQAGVDLRGLSRRHDGHGGCATSATRTTFPPQGKVGGGFHTSRYETIDCNETDVSFVSGGSAAQVAEVAQTPPTTSTVGRRKAWQPSFSDRLDSADLPHLLCRIRELHGTNPHECDAMMLGALNVVSGMIGSSAPGQKSSVYGIYDRRRVYANLNNIVYASSGSNKGELAHCPKLAAPLQREINETIKAEQQQYEAELAAYEATPKKDRGAAPRKPSYRGVFVPANSSVSGVYRSLDANGGWGEMFDTEADTMTNMLKSDYGDYSDLVRKAFHHETLSMNRVTEDIHIDIEEPRLSVFITCTPGQLPRLFPSSSFENGFGSRFLFYSIPDDEDVTFRDVFANSDRPLDETYEGMGHRLLSLVHELWRRAGNPLQFVLTEAQQKLFLTTFESVLREEFAMLGDGFRPFVLRIALSCYRYAMVLSLLRRLD
ncbi:MAG: DUF3987 domain-containing protein, partial [Bacteroidales bacterium]|nr:DUF3987 domain-containing protein [Bacteroidales bacterium]